MEPGAVWEEDVNIRISENKKRINFKFNQRQHDINSFVQ